MLKRLSLALAAAAIALVACAAVPALVADVALWPTETPPRAHVAIHAEALASLESLASVSRATRTEQAACVTEFGMLPLQHGQWVVAILAIGRAAVERSDSLAVYGRGPLCARGLPVVHSHVVANAVWARPSEFDLQRFRQLADSDYGAPFAVLVSVGARAPSRITVYGLAR